jgi:Flp pilus assembly pilin Flp
VNLEDGVSTFAVQVYWVDIFHHDDGGLSMFLRIGQLFNNRSMARTLEHTVIAVAVAVAIVAIVHGFGDSLTTTSPSFALK